VALVGIQGDGRLYRPVGPDARPVPVPAEGLLISAKLAEVLRVAPGDPLLVEVLEGRRPTLWLQVARLVTDYTGLNATMDLHALNRALGEENDVSGLWLDVDPARTDALHARLKETPRVAGVGIKLAALRSFQDTMAQTMLTIRAFYVLFACIIAFGVVYNTARISLAERSRELATMRVMGFTRREISAILLGELGLLVLLALPIGLALGHAFVWLALQAVDSEVYRFPLHVSRWTQAFAVSVVLGAAFLSSLAVRRKLDHLDLVAVLKSKE
jgi:putative ABC transport system permease protein